MALLQYDISVVGAKNVERALASIERRFVTHNRKVSRTLGSSGKRAGNYRSNAGSDARTAASAQRRVHGERMQQISQEERARIRAEHRIHRIARRNQRRRARSNRRARVAEERATARARTQFRGQVYSNMRGTVGSVGRYGLMAASMGGGLALAGSLQSERDVGKQAMGLAIQGQRSQGKSRGGTVQDRYRRVRGTVGALGQMGFDRDGVVRAMRGYQSITGDFDTANKLAGEFSKLAISSGADYGDVGKTAGEFDMALKGQGMGDATKRRAAVKDLMRTAAASGAMGSIEFSELAGISSQLGASGARYTDMDPVERIKYALSAAQLAKMGGASSGAEAGTALMRSSDDILKNSGKFKKLGIDTGTYDDEGVRTGTKNPIQLLAETLKKTKGDVGVISDLFGIRGAKIGENLMTQAKAQGVSIEDLLKPFMNATLTDAELDRDTGAALSTTDAKMTAVANKFNERLGPKMAQLLEKLLPAFEKLFPAVEKAADMFVRFVDWFSDNPVKGVGAVILAAVAKDVGSAAIGQTIKSILMRSAPGGIAPKGAPGGATALTTSIAGTAGITAGIYGAYKGSNIAGDVYKDAGFGDTLSKGLGALQGYGAVLTAGTSAPIAAARSAITGESFENAFFGGNPASAKIDTSGLDKMAAQAQSALTKAAQDLSSSAEAIKSNSSGNGATGVPNRGNSPTAP